MQKSITQIKREIEQLKKRVKTNQESAKKMNEKKKLEKELFLLKNRSLVSGGIKAKALSQRLGRGIVSISKKAYPVVKKQARLIRDQQLRDDALEKARGRVRSKSPKKRTKEKYETPNPSSNIFSNLDF